MNIFLLIIYAVFKIGTLSESMKSLNRNIKKIVFIIICGPFVLYILFQSLRFITYNVLPSLNKVGLYWTWLPYDYFTDPLNINETLIRVKPDWYLENFHDGLPKWLPVANLYLVISFIYNWYSSTDLDDLLDVFHFSVITMIQPVIFYIVINDVMYDYTIRPWVCYFGQTCTDNKDEVVDTLYV